MKVALIQTDLVWENKKANLNNFEDKIRKGAADLFVLPEMFQTGFSMNPQPLAEAMDGNTVRWMKSLAVEKSAAICGSIIIEENGSYFNRFLFCTPDSVFTYDKRHLFSLAGEDKEYRKGQRKVIVDYMGWKICLQVCYDLRFPVFSRNVEEYDLLIYVANWPLPRISAWDTLISARAIENMCYAVGVNRIGRDGNNHEYPGHSKAVDFLGNVVLDIGTDDGLETITLDREMMLTTRKKLNFLADRDDFTVN